MKMSSQGNPHNTSRVFLAIRLPLSMAATLNKKARHRAGELVDNLRWVAPQQQHITLRFLGDVSSEQLQLLAARFARVLCNNYTFDCLTGQFELFPNARHPRVLALGMHSGQELKRLAAICEQVAVDCGLPREPRYYKPHVTLGRFKGQHHVTHSHFYNLPSSRMTVDEIHLIESVPHAGGTEYKTLNVFPLQLMAQTA